MNGDGAFLLAMCREDSVRDKINEFSDLRWRARHRAAAALLAEVSGVLLVAAARMSTAAADRDDFKAAGLDTYEMFDFSRDAALPDGSTATVGFTLAFATVPELPDAVAFTCQQWRPDLFWKPEYQNHANGAVTISEMFMVADDGAAPAKLLNGLDLDPIGGKTSVTTPEAFAARFAGAEIASSYAGFRVAVSDMEAARTCLEENRVAYEETAETIWITPAAGFGCVIEFAPHRGDG